MEPRIISVCVPTFNRADELKRTLDSILNQTFKNFELIVVDDGSVDKTADVILSIGDPRIRYFKNPKNLGLYPNWNRCLELACGEYIAIYHDNDLYDSHIVERCVNMLLKYPEASFVFTGCQTIDSEQNVVEIFIEQWAPPLIPGKMIIQKMARRWSSFVQASTVMARREMYNRVGGYAVDLGLPGDMDMWVRLASVGDVIYIPEPLVKLALRSPTGYTSQPKWQNIKALAHIQRINWMKAYTGSKLMLLAGNIWCPTRRDIGYLLFLCRAIIHGDKDIIRESIDIFAKECYLVTKGLAFLLRRISIAPYMLGIALFLYRFWRKPGLSS